MLLMFVMFLNVFQPFLQVVQTLVLSVLSIFFSMLQLLHLDVSKVDRVLYMRCAWKAAGGANDVRGGVANLMRYVLVHSLCGQHPDASVRIGR
jgi:hypothetical protein